MKKIFIIGLKLTVICAVSALLLGMVNAATAPKIAELKEIALKEALSVIIKSGEAESEKFIEDEKVQSYYPVLLDNDEKAGYILTLIGDGYAGNMKILANYDRSGEFIAGVLMDNQETPGLGKEAEKIEYMDKFIGTGNDKPVPVKKSQLSPSEADSVSGATVTFAGIGNALEYGSDFVKKLGEKP